MDIYESIYTRRTIRDFTQRPISDETLKKIIEAGMQAPSNDHMRNWEFVVIRDRQVMLRLIDRVGKLDRQQTAEWLNSWGAADEHQRAMYLDAVPKQQQMLLNAACVVLPFFRQQSPLLEPRNLSSLNMFASIWCCIENMLLASAAEGIFGVTRIPFDEEELANIKEVLSVPQGYEVPCYLALGYPAEGAARYQPLPAAVEDRIHLNHW